MKTGYMEYDTINESSTEIETNLIASGDIIVIKEDCGIYNLINNHMIDGKFNVDISKLEDGKCYVIGIDLNEIKPDVANKAFCVLKNAVAGRGIELFAIPKQMKIEENHAE